MFAPGWCGMDRVSSTLFVERSMGAEARAELQHHVDLGRETAARFYGHLTADPYFVACATTACAERFGSYGEPAAALGDIAIRLAPNGETSALIAHEMSHAELYRRVGGWRHIRTVPRWFDEGIAVVVANEPKNSIEVCQEIRRRNITTPSIHDLISRYLSPGPALGPACNAAVASLRGCSGVESADNSGGSLRLPRRLR